MEDRIKLSHGAGGESMTGLIKEHILTHFAPTNDGNREIKIGIRQLDDSAVVGDTVFTIDGHTVKPLFFPGGDLGSLAVAGTVNDIAVMGGEPLAMASSFIIEEGLPMETFERVCESMGKTAKAAGVPLVTGDTKVVEKGSIDKFMVITSAFGKMSPYLKSNLDEARIYRPLDTEWLKDSNLAEGDVIIVSGNIADHGVAILSGREGYGFDTNIKSDVAPINGLIGEALKVGGVTVAKDPTRGGIANTLNEWAEKSKVGILIDEERIPLAKGTLAACEMLGIDPLNVGNEGKLVLGVVPGKADGVLAALRAHPLGKNAAIIGRATSKIRGVVMETLVGGKRIVEPPVGDPVPRIC
ncbi:MAG: hydrogenase expression/formation protein HypE [Thermoplasmata archaeon HGW-Thermoplasmata-1]|nr:MAG: hydrogenase expression/formation protein HypE [Thermoplasmata archaeon HGW-Thermoplasmata-1]